MHNIGTLIAVYKRSLQQVSVSECTNLMHSDLAIAQRIGQVPPHAGQGDLLHEMSALEADHDLPLWTRHG